LKGSPNKKKKKKNNNNNNMSSDIGSVADLKIRQIFGAT